jgi:hypothetical protein
MKNPIFLLRRAIGRMKGYGGCLNCGGTWNFKKPFDIKDRNSGAPFPICTDCAKKLSPQQIMGYLEELYEWWVREGWATQEEVDRRLAYVRKNCSIEKALETTKQ